MNEELRIALQNFLNLRLNVEMQEAVVNECKRELDELYPKLIEACPHPIALDHNYGNGSGVFRVCTSCGLEDRASEGGTPGDEYDYGYPGHPNREFWKNTKIHIAKNKDEHWTYRKGHGYRVVGGKVTK